MSAIIGIDLGTTFSAVARLDETGRPVIVRNSEGENITPSVVLFSADSKQVIVGEEARKLYQLDPESFGRFKRKMGIDEVYNSCTGTHTPTSLSSLVLKHLKQETEKSVGQITEAVITIPANFAKEAREATMNAARSAGFDVKHIINEPTAAAMYFAYDSEVELDGIYAVYDLGGGTFDVSIIRVNGSDIDVLASEGVSQLGGDDFDRKIQEMVARKYHDLNGGQLSREDYTANDAEEDKKSLSRRIEVNVRAAGDNGRENITLSRSDFEETISSLIAQTEMLCETVIDEAGVSISEIKEVILAGGSTRTPIVQASVTKVFGKEPITFGNPDEVVALGAALYAAHKTDNSNLNAIQQASVERIKLSEITGKYFGTIAVTYNEAREEEQLQNSPIIRKGEKIPCSVSESFFTRHDNQTTVRCQITESNAPETDPKFVRTIWEGDLSLPSGRPSGQEIKISYSYDSNQMMHCTFEDVVTGKITEVDLSISGNEQSEKIDIDKFLVE